MRGGWEIFRMNKLLQLADRAALTQARQVGGTAIQDVHAAAIIHAPGEHRSRLDQAAQSAICARGEAGLTRFHATPLLCKGEPHRITNRSRCALKDLSVCDVSMLATWAEKGSVILHNERCDFSQFAVEL